VGSKMDLNIKNSDLNGLFNEKQRPNAWQSEVFICSIRTEGYDEVLEQNMFGEFDEKQDDYIN
jgi:hypothetical protein